MNKMTAQEIISKLEELKITTGERLVNQMEGYTPYEDEEFEVLDESAMDMIFGKIEEVHSEGDSEGGGEYSEKVYLFHNHNVYLKVTGRYLSYDGTTWYKPIKETKPENKTIVVYN